MKHIIKSGAPREYVTWRKNMNGEVNEDYRHLQHPERGLLHDTLISEQGGICGYTMRRIDKASSHIEHIKPESLCRNELKGSDLDYENMVACYPKEGMKSPYRYGAQLKNDWWENEGVEFISPLQTQCETLITFNIKGEVSPLGDNAHAKRTIEVLGLDHLSLTEDRKRAISEFINGKSGDTPLNVNKTIHAIQHIIQRDTRGNFVEFCIAIRYALIAHNKYLAKIAQKKKFAVKVNPKK